MPSNDRRTLAYAVVGFAVPAVVTAVAVIVQIAVMPDVPDEIALHWNASGDADGWGSPWTMVVAAIVAGLASIGVAAVNFRQLRDGTPGGTFRWLSTAAAALSTATAVVFAGALVAQSGGDTASPAPIIGIAALAALVVGVAGRLVQPADPPADPGRNVEPMELSPRGRAVWLHTETASRGVLVLVGLVLVFAAISTLTAWMSGGSTTSVWAGIAVVAVTVAALSTIVAFHIRIDSSGLTIRSIAGIPRWHVRASDIEDVSVVDIRAIGDFGGYGIRFSRGRMGIVLRSGSAVSVARRGGRPLVITVDDAPTAAALLAAVAAKAAE